MAEEDRNGLRWFSVENGRRSRLGEVVGRERFPGHCGGPTKVRHCECRVVSSRSPGKIQVERRWMPV